MKATVEKTNVMRILEQASVNYIPHTYAADLTNGLEIAKALGQDENSVFKTLVTVGKSGQNYVFVLPVNCELDLRKAATAVGEKSVEMLKSKQLLPLTGYIHGGCSPIGMKKHFPTVFDESIFLYDTVTFSGGKVGFQVEVAPNDIAKIVEYSLADLTAF